MKLQLPKLNKRQRSTHPPPSSPLRRRRRGQSLVEAALLLPFLILLFSIVIEAGLAINAWIRVNTAARDATRFVVDAGRSNDASSLVLSKLVGINFGTDRSSVGSRDLDVFVIKGTTNSAGHISAAAWASGTEHVYDGNSDASPVHLVRTTIENRLAANGKNPSNVRFVIVEVDFNYTPLLATLMSPTAKMPMNSYAVIQQY